MKRVVLAWAMVFVACSAPAAVRADNYTGTWSVSPSSKSGEVQLEVRYVRTGTFGSEQWDESHDAPLSELHGLSSADLNSNGQPKHFDIAEDAGTFRATGTFASGTGAGTWTFVPSTTFADSLRKRGIDAPNEKQQFQLAMSGFKLSTLDSLLNGGFERPSVGDLVEMGEHGVTDSYIAAMKNVPLSPKRVSDLIRMRDHGVSSEYVQRLNQMGYHPDAGDLVRLVDHGVSTSFIERMRSHGYTHLSVEDLIRLRDHGF